MCRPNQVLPLLKNCAASQVNQGVTAAINGNIEIDAQAIHLLMLMQAFSLFCCYLSMAL